MKSVSRIQLGSVEELQLALQKVFDVAITQSDPGSFDTTLRSINIGDCLVFGSSATRAMVCSGRRSEAYWTVTPITRFSAGGRFRGQALEEGDLLLLDPGGEVFQQTMEGHSQLAVSIPIAVAERIIGLEHDVDPEPLINRWFRKKAPNTSMQLDRMLTRLLSGDVSSGIGEDTEAAELAGHVIAMALSGHPLRSLRASLANRRRIVTRAEELMRSRLHSPPSVTELCEATHSSRRLLFYAFHELLGRSPISHLRILRLHAARRRIRFGHGVTPIQQIAAELGFPHPGQFAIDYGRLFGESPRQTRRLWRGEAFTNKTRRPLGDAPQ